MSYRIVLGAGLSQTFTEKNRNRREAFKKLLDSVSSMFAVEIQHILPTVTLPRDYGDITDGKPGVSYITRKDTINEKFKISLGEACRNNGLICRQRHTKSTEMQKQCTIIDQLYNGSKDDKEVAFNMLSEKIILHPRTPDLQKRYVRSVIDFIYNKEEKLKGPRKKDLVEKALDVCKAYIEVNDQDPFIHKWFGVLSGHYAQFQPPVEKIKLGNKYRVHVQKSIDLDPTDASSYFFLGRWCYDVWKLPWILQQVAALVFEEAPTSTVQEALKNFLYAEELQPGFSKVNSLMISKCYDYIGNLQESKEWLVKANDIKPITNEDEDAQYEIEKLLKRRQGF